ncbi:astacin-like metalloendopeptidase isoform X2 [Struthio camelus]|uniref:astacin-like metalloendopeptidase isoform X2 n=1 Tax=Struthio camelus TaxID=8801 RepID=UPI003603C134
MALARSVWLLLSSIFWLLEGGPGGAQHTGSPQRGGGGPRGDDILSINGALAPLKAPDSSFLVEGDIVRADPSRAFAAANPKWPKRRGVVQIPYIMSDRYDNASVKILEEAFGDFARLTCVRCFSSVGRAGGMQPLSLAPACLQRGKGVALHELMHVAGFWHEHSRADRDDYISISWDHILPGFEGNFMKSRTPNMLVGYDYSSVLHYSRYAFSRSGAPTITPLRTPAAVLGQRRQLSASDAARVNLLYGCRGAARPSPRVLPPPTAEGTSSSAATARHPGASHPSPVAPTETAAPGTGGGRAGGRTAPGATTSE